MFYLRCSTGMVKARSSQSAAEINDVEWGLVQPLLPIGGNAARGSGDRLIQRMAVRRRERGTFQEFIRREVVVPILARFEALDHYVPCRRRVL